MCRIDRFLGVYHNCLLVMFVVFDLLNISDFTRTLLMSVQFSGSQNLMFFNEGK